MPMAFNLGHKLWEDNISGSCEKWLNILASFIAFFLLLSYILKMSLQLDSRTENLKSRENWDHEKNEKSKRKRKNLWVFVLRWAGLRIFRADLNNLKHVVKYDCTSTLFTTISKMLMTIFSYNYLDISINISQPFPMRLSLRECSKGKKSSFSFVSSKRKVIYRSSHTYYYIFYIISCFFYTQ